jgi:hypothetical protein
MARSIEETSHPSLELITMIPNGGKAIGHAAKKDRGQKSTLGTTWQSTSGRFLDHLKYVAVVKGVSIIITKSTIKGCDVIIIVTDHCLDKHTTLMHSRTTRHVGGHEDAGGTRGGRNPVRRK